MHLNLAKLTVMLCMPKKYFMGGSHYAYTNANMPGHDESDKDQTAVRCMPTCCMKHANPVQMNTWNLKMT